MRFNKWLIPALLFPLSMLVTGCDIVDQIAEGNLSLEIGGLVLIGPGAKRENAPILSGIPKFPKKIEVEKKVQSWGSCEKNAQPSGVEGFRKAQAEVSEIWVATYAGDRVEKLKVARKTINLFRLASEVSALLTEAQIPSGEYKEVQVMLSKAIVTDASGKVWPLDIPEGDKNGVRIQLERNLVIGENGEKPRVSLTFCTESNFVLEKIGNQNRKIGFHPIIDQVANLSL